ncbi:MAG: glycosyl transferase family 4 [Halioglobus sp.]
MTAWVMLLPLTALCSVLLCIVYRQLALRFHLLDTPNQRSSHQSPTPNGAGVAILFSFVFALVAASSDQFSMPAIGWAEPYVFIALFALALSLLGVVDDVVSLSVRLRFTIYALVCLVSVLMLLGGSGVLGAEFAVSSLTAYRLAVVAGTAFGLLWLVNLYNFMDGIDGIAAVQTVSVCTFAAGLAYLSGSGEQYVLYCLLLAAAHAGFLVLNWQPAKLFMGDAGSIATGFTVGALIVYGAVTQALNPLCWLILLAVFLVDASWTLAWRVTTGQPFTQAHRTHAYQRLSRHFGSHAKVDLILLAINGLWLAPLALAVVAWPQHGLILVILAYLPLLAGMANIRRFT